MSSAEQVHAENASSLRAVVVQGREPATVRDGRWLTCLTTSGCWIIDLATSSMCSADHECDPRFVSGEHWQGFEAVWVGDDMLRAELCTGVTVSAQRAR